MRNRIAAVCQILGGLGLFSMPLLWATDALAQPVLGGYVATSIAVLVFGLVVA